MAREILFRGKRKDNGKWVEGGYAEHDGKVFIVTWVRYTPDTRDWDTVEYYENNPHYESALIEVVSETVCQYTGLKDKNGRKIFEGDILLHESVGNVKVQFEKSEFLTVGISHDMFSTLLSSIYKDCEVIGSIFDNPELIGDQP